MNIDSALIDHLSHLAKLEFDEKGKQKIASDLTRILEFVDALDKVDVTGVEPLIHMTEEAGIPREDIAQNPISQQEALSNAPVKDSDYFKVPKVMR